MNGPSVELPSLENSSGSQSQAVDLTQETHTPSTQGGQKELRYPSFSAMLADDSLESAGPQSHAPAWKDDQQSQDPRDMNASKKSGLNGPGPAKRSPALSQESHKQSALPTQADQWHDSSLVPVPYQIAILGNEPPLLPRPERSYSEERHSLVGGENLQPALPGQGGSVESKLFAGVTGFESLNPKNSSLSVMPHEGREKKKRNSGADAEGDSDGTDGEYLPTNRRPRKTKPSNRISKVPGAARKALGISGKGLERKMEMADSVKDLVDKGWTVRDAAAYLEV